MTNCSSFKLGNTGHSYYFIFGVWLLNVCHVFIDSLSTFSLKMESLEKWKSFEIEVRKVRVNGGWVQSY